MKECYISHNNKNYAFKIPFDYDNYPLKNMNVIAHIKNYLFR